MKAPDYPYLSRKPCWVAGGHHYATRRAARATGQRVTRAPWRCIRAACYGCGALPALGAAHCTSWAEARHTIDTARWHREDHRRLLWCPSCWPTRPAGPPAPECPHDVRQMAITDYVAPSRVT